MIYVERCSVLLIISSYKSFSKVNYQNGVSSKENAKFLTF